LISSLTYSANIYVIPLPLLYNPLICSTCITKILARRSRSRSLYVVVRPSVCNVRAPYSGDWNFR